MKKASKQGVIVAIGGGELKDLDTLPIDKAIVKSTGRIKPNALFIPTASGDALGYWETFKAIYGEKLGCKTDVLMLTRKKLTAGNIKKKILSADLIYVGGGNTAKMMRIWRKTCTDKYLIQAYKNGAVLSGISAGAICWFKYGLSDSRRFKDNNQNFAFMRVKGLGLIPCLVSPHHIREKEKRNPGILEMMKKTDGIGLAMDDNSALIVKGNNYAVLTSKPKAKIIKVFRNGSKIIQRETAKNGTLKDLLSRADD